LNQGYPLLLEWIDTARLFGDVDEPWMAVEIVHQLELRRYEILGASDESTIASLYCEIFLEDYPADSLKLSPEVRAVYLNSPHLLMDDRWEAVLDGLHGYKK